MHVVVCVCTPASSSPSHTSITPQTAASKPDLICEQFPSSLYSPDQTSSLSPPSHKSFSSPHKRMDRQRSSNQGGSNSAAKPHQQQLNSAHRQQHANKPAATNSGSGGHKRKPPPPQQQQQQQQHSKKMRNSDRQAQHLQQQQQWQAKKQHNNQTQQQKQQQPQQPPTKKQMKKQQKQQQAQQQEIPTSPGQQLKRLQQYHQFLNSMQRHQQQLQRQGHVAEPLQASPADTSAAETALQMLVQSQVGGWHSKIVLLASAHSVALAHAVQDLFQRIQHSDNTCRHVFSVHLFPTPSHTSSASAAPGAEAPRQLQHRQGTRGAACCSRAQPCGLVLPWLCGPTGAQPCCKQLPHHPACGAAAPARPPGPA